MKSDFAVTLDNRPRLVVIEKSHLYLNPNPPKPGGSMNVQTPAPSKQAPAMTPAARAPKK